MIITGIAVGLYGYLFPGNINLMVMDLYKAKSFKLLLFVLALIVLFESIYCGISLTLLKTVNLNSGFYKLTEAICYWMVLVMGLWMVTEKRFNKKDIHPGTLTRGILNIVVHPQQLPFWLITGVIVNRNIELKTANCTLQTFILFNACGALLAMMLYMLYGNRLLNYFKLNIHDINKTMGMLYLLLALYHLL